MWCWACTVFACLPPRSGGACILPLQCTASLWSGRKSLAATTLHYLHYLDVLGPSSVRRCALSCSVPRCSNTYYLPYLCLHYSPHAPRSHRRVWCVCVCDVGIPGWLLIRGGWSAQNTRAAALWSRWCRSRSRSWSRSLGLSFWAQELPQARRSERANELAGRLAGGWILRSSCLAVLGKKTLVSACWVALCRRWVIMGCSLLNSVHGEARGVFPALITWLEFGIDGWDGLRCTPERGCARSERGCRRGSQAGAG